MQPSLQGLLAEEIRTAIGQIENRVVDLLPEERPLISSAVASRQYEFSTGRFLSRRLLGEIGYGRFALLRDEDRVPVWPSGVVGSITHSDSLCAVAVGSDSEFLGIGLDLEPDEPVSPGIERVVCRGAEHDWVAEIPGDEQGRRCRIVFSVKEAVYKAFYPRTRVFWSFQDVGVAIDLGAGTYKAWLPESAGQETIEGRVLRRDGWILSGAEVRCPQKT